MNALSRKLANDIIDLCHGVTIREALDALSCARNLVDAQAEVARVDKDGELKTDLVALGVKRDVIGG